MHKKQKLSCYRRPFLLALWLAFTAPLFMPPEAIIQATQKMTDDHLIKSALETIRLEANAVIALSHRISTSFAKACRIMLACKGRIVVTGMGKSGHIGSKIAATLASTGTPAFFVHPGEASHGDLGMLTPHDVVLALSYSGYTKEITTLLPTLETMKIPLISLSGRANSLLAKSSTVFLDTSISEEACPLGLAPTSSTTTTLVMGDALAIALLRLRNFTKEDFARAHPGGSLGKQLLLKVKDVMHTKDKIPISRPNDRLNRVLIEMNDKRLGFTTIVDDKTNRLVGIFTDGDLRRVVDQGTDIHATLVQNVMTSHALTCSPNILASHAFNIMKKNRITALVITNIQQQPVGVLHLHDLLQLGIT